MNKKTKCYIYGRLTKAEYNRIRKEMIMSTSIISDGQEFNLTYTFFDDNHETEIAMLVNGENILLFSEHKGETVIATVSPLCS